MTKIVNYFLIEINDKFNGCKSIKENDLNRVYSSIIDSSKVFSMFKVTTKPKESRERKRTKRPKESLYYIGFTSENFKNLPFVL